MKLLNFFMIILPFLFFNLVIKKLDIKLYPIESFTPSYQQCINNGYTKEFCSQTPTSSFGPNVCLCNNGSMGYILPGFRGKCVCQDQY